MASVNKELTTATNELLPHLRERNNHHAIVLELDAQGFPVVALIDLTNDESTDCDYVVILDTSDDLSDLEVGDINFDAEVVKLRP